MSEFKEWQDRVCNPANTPSVLKCPKNIGCLSCIEARKEGYLAALKFAKSIGHLYAKDTEVEDTIQQEIEAVEND